MESKKVTLIEALTSVVTALRNNTIAYNWIKQNTCNCGLVAQAITRTGNEELSRDYIQPISTPLKEKKKSKFCPSWSDMVAEYCPLTGEPIAEVFKKLYEAGLTREDIGHLEYLSDPIILKKINIDTNSTTETYSKTETKEQGWWIFKKTVEFKVEKTKNNHYYQKKENLIAYLEAWIEILKNKGPKSNVIVIDKVEYKYQNYIQLENLKKDFLKKEKYEAVTKIQEELNKLNK